MSKRITKEILLTNPNASELEHLFSYSQIHHVFNLTIMCIKYKVEYLNGEIYKIEFHEDYKDCFKPIMKVQQVSETIKNMATSLINYYLDENTWLKGWDKDWSLEFEKIWNQKMRLNPLNFHYNYFDYEESLAYFLLKSFQNSALVCKIF